MSKWNKSPRSLIYFAYEYEHFFLFSKLEIFSNFCKMYAINFVLGTHNFKLLQKCKNYILEKYPMLIFLSIRKRLFAGTIPANKNLFAGTSPSKKGLICRNLSSRLTFYFWPQKRILWPKKIVRQKVIAAPILLYGSNLRFWILNGKF